MSNIAYGQNLAEKVNAYFEAQMQVEHRNAKESDVNKLLALLTHDATFEHPSFNAVQTKEQYKKGLLYYLGQYGSCDIQIKNMIEGLNAITVEYLHPCSNPEGVKFEDSEERLVTLFEFTEGKISLIRHYF